MSFIYLSVFELSPFQGLLGLVMGTALFHTVDVDSVLSWQSTGLLIEDILLNRVFRGRFSLKCTRVIGGTVPVQRARSNYFTLR